MWFGGVEKFLFYIRLWSLFFIRFVTLRAFGSMQHHRYLFLFFFLDKRDQSRQQDTENFLLPIRFWRIFFYFPVKNKFTLKFEDKVGKNNHWFSHITVFSSLMCPAQYCFQHTTVFKTFSGVALYTRAHLRGEQKL